MMRQWVLIVAACSGSELDPDAAAPRCEPPSEVRWLTEGETVAIALSCATGLPVPSAALTAGGPAAAQWNDAQHELTWQTTLADAAVYDISVQLATGETASWKIGVADAFANPDNLPIARPEDYPAEFGIRTVHLSAEPQAPVYEPIIVTYQGRTFPIAAKQRGASSLAYPQKSFTLDFANAPLSDVNAGFIGKEKLVLVSTFDDNSYLRVMLTWQVWNRLMPTVPVAGGPVVVYVANEFRGLYFFGDHIDDELMREHGLPDGNLYKAFNHDANFMTVRYDGSPKATLHDGYEKKSGLPLEDFSDLDALVAFVATGDEASFTNALPTTISMNDYGAWFAMLQFTVAADSAGKNSYHHASPGGIWHVVPWDFNASFGQSWETSRADNQVSDYRNLNRLFARWVDHPTFGPDLRARVRAAALGPVSETVLLSLIDEWTLALAPVATRSWQRWGDEHRAFFAHRTDFTTPTEEVAYLRSWVQAQLALVLATY